MSNTKYTVPVRRKREGKTDYKRRLELLKGRKDRLVIRTSNTQVIIQVVRFEPTGDKVIVTTQSGELKKKGWKHSCKNLPAAYPAGVLAAQKAKAKGVEEAVLDLGLQTPLKGSRLFAALKGAIDGGLNVPAGEGIFPSEQRIKGEHVSGYVEKSKTITSDFEKLKSAIMK